MAETKAEIEAQKNELQTQNEQLMAELEALKKEKAAMEAEKAAAPAPAENPDDDLVIVQLPVIPGEPRDQPVGVNGKVWLIKRGKRVKVPRYVKEVLDHTDEQLARAEELSEEAVEIYENQISDMAKG